MKKYKLFTFLCGLNLIGYYLTLLKQPDRQMSYLVDIKAHRSAHTTFLWPKNSTHFQVDLQCNLLWQALQQNKLLQNLRPELCYKKVSFFNVFHPEVYNINTTCQSITKHFYFIYNKNSILSVGHVSTFIRSSSGPLRKEIQELFIFQ